MLKLQYCTINTQTMRKVVLQNVYETTMEINFQWTCISVTAFLYIIMADYTPWSDVIHNLLSLPCCTGYLMYTFISRHHYVPPLYKLTACFFLGIVPTSIVSYSLSSVICFINRASNERSDQIKVPQLISLHTWHHVIHKKNHILYHHPVSWSLIVFCTSVDRWNAGRRFTLWC